MEKVIIPTLFKIDSVREIYAKMPLTLDSFRPQRSIMSIHRRFAPIGVRFEPEQVADFTGIHNN